MFFSHGKLVLCVAVSTTDRQVSPLAAFLQAEDRSMFKGLKSDSTTRSHVCLGRHIRLRNDLYCVEWDVKLYYTIPY